MLEAGIDINTFKPNSCRSASTSAVSNAGAPLHTVLKAGDWSNSKTFFTHYKKDIEISYPDNVNIEPDFGNTLLDSL